LTLKQQLHARCLEQVQQRISAAQETIGYAQGSANEETKSSAGDKYETGRAMAQLEIEKHQAQLAEAFKLKHILEKISPDQSSPTIQPGSLVITSQGNFYIAVSAGQFLLNDKTYFVISAASPLAQKLVGLKIHSVLPFQGRSFVIEEIL
jgi:hypothetical protein